MVNINEWGGGGSVDFPLTSTVGKSAKELNVVHCNLSFTDSFR